MRPFVLLAALVLFSAATGLLSYYQRGRGEAIAYAPSLIRRAHELVGEGEGPDDLGPGRVAMLLAVEDPAFNAHAGSDVATPGAGKTTITQSLAKRLAFDRFEPGVAKIRQTGYAHGPEKRLSKRDILTLWLATVEMGRGPHGPMKGFFEASRDIYGRAPAQLSDREFLRLVAAGIAPTRLTLNVPNPALDERVSRIERLLAGQCAPRGNGDVWLEGCTRR